MPNPQKIQSMFNDISSGYDLLNDVLSLGIHRIWKKKLVRKILATKPQSFLDGATGTGDIVEMISKHNPSLQAMGIDFSKNMVINAKKRNPNLSFQEDDLMSLSFADKSYDASNVSFGIRNVSDHKLALKELARVTSKNIFIMEFGQPENTFFRKAYFFVMKTFVPLIGKLFGKKEAYKYLIESSSTFPSGKVFTEHMKEATGAKVVTYTPLMGGTVYIYHAQL